MKSRILIFLLTAAMLCTMSGFVYAEEPAVVVDTAAADFLGSLGIMQTMEEEAYSGYVTREDFAYSTARLMGLSGSSSVRYYTDLRAESYAFGYINDLAEAGVLSPSADDMFRPFDYVTYDEAYKMIVTALGYKPMAEIRGGYPRGYNVVANMIDINDGSSTGDVTWASAVNILYNALKSCPYEVAKISPDGTTFYESDECYANRRFNLDFFEGTVRATHYGSLDEGTVLEAKKVKIGDKVYDAGDGFDESAALGCYAEFFCTDDERPEVVYMKEIARAEKIVIDIENFVKFENNTVEYYEELSDDKITKRAVEDNNIIYNGLPLRSYIRETLSSLNKGTITLRDSDDNGKYDIIDIRDYKNFYVKFNDGYKFYNELLFDDYIDFASADSITVIKGGSLISETELTADMSLSVAKSLDGKVLNVVVSDAVTGVYNKNLDDEIEVDGKLYPLEKSYHVIFPEEAEIGGTYKFSVDFLGNIVYAKHAEARRMTLGYIINAISAEEVFDDSALIKLMDADGNKHELECAENITIDAVKYKEQSADKIIDVLKNGKVHARQLIQYELDTDGKIKEIDTVKKNPGEDPDYSLRPAFDEVKSRWYHLGRYGFTAICTNDSIAFCIPSNGSTDEKDYFVGRGAQKITDSSDCYWALDCYYTGESSAYVDAIIGEMDIDDYIPRTVLMYEEGTEALDDEGNIVYKLKGYNMGLAQEFILEDDVTGVERLGTFNRGDLLVLQENQAGDVSVIEKVFDAKTKTPIGWEYETDKELLYVDGFKEHYCEELNLSFGYVRKNYGDVISMSKTPTAEISERLLTNKRLNMLYDSETDTIELVTGDKIVDYETAGESCMRVVHHMWYEDGRGVYLFK